MRREHRLPGLAAAVVPERLTLILLANGEGIWWGKPLDKGEVEKSPFARVFLDQFVFGGGGR